MSSFFSEIFLLALYFITACGIILRLPCKEVGNFSVIKENVALQGSVIATFPSLTEVECEHECLINNQCKSINQEKDDKTCELNSKSPDPTVPQSLLVPKNGWMYKATNYSERLIGENCQTMTPCRSGHACMDTCSCPGYECMLLFKDCNEVKDRDYNVSGIYQISNSGFSDQWLPVFCDMATDGGGWIVFQRRIDSSTDFYRNWNEYKKGFGEITGDFWLGLDNLHTLAAPGKRAVLRVDLKHRDDTNKVYAYYSTFEIGNEAEGYQLKIGGYTGTAGDSLAMQDGMKFTTYDSDNDISHYNCAVKFKGAWWYRYCHHSNLNGLYPSDIPSTNPKYMSWKTLKGFHGNIMFSEMKLRYA